MLGLICILHADLFGQAFVTNGSASFLGGECYQITPDNSGQAGTIFSQNTINLTQPFSESATFFFGCKDVNGADGIVFILATSNTSLGIGGGSLGYDGITPSIAIEYDDYQNGNFGDPASDHMAVISMGSVNHNLASNLVGPVNISNVEDCMEHCFSVAWDPNTQTLSAILDDDLISYTGDIVTNIFSGNANVYYGFSSATGSLSNQHIVCFGPPEVDMMPDEIICESENVILQADPDGIAWTWMPDPTLSSFTISNPIASPTTTTTYTTIIEYACGFLGYDTVVVNVNPPPFAFATNDGPVCIDETLTLMSGDGLSYQWSGPMSFFSNNQNPQIANVTIGHAGIYSVTVTDINGCTAEATTLVVIDEGPEILVDPIPDPICLNLDPFQMTASPPGGDWSGDITFDGIFDPDYVGEGIHVVTYTVTNGNGCSSTEDVIIEVLPIPEVLIDPPGVLCETSGPVQLTGSPSGGFWEGEISINGLFDPGQAGDGPHLITYTANDGNGCTNFADIIIEVVPGLVADITPSGPFCATDSIVQFSADPIGGVWSGDANAMGLLFPPDLGAGTYTVSYMLNDTSGCYSGQLNFEILLSPAVTIDPVDTFCLNQSTYTLTASPPGGDWGGAANLNGEIDPMTLGSGTHQATYTFVTPQGCAGSDTISIVVLPAAPQIGNVNVQCDSLGTTFVVTFAISGGDPASYEIDGSVSGSLTPGSPSIFTSFPINSGGAYNFIVDDANHCNPDTLSGDFTCNCETNAGSMNVNLITACEGDTIFVLPPTGVVLDPDDTLLYVLHLGFPDNILMVSDTNFFVFTPPLQSGITYFISSVAGNALPGMGVDLNDPCLSVSFGTPVMWSAPPDGYISAPMQLCSGDSIPLSFVLSGGSGTYNVIYTDGSDYFSVDSILSGHSLDISPAVLSTLTLVKVEDIAFPYCIGFPDTSIVIQVNDPYLTHDDIAICFGDSIFLGGAYQFDSGIYYDSLVAITGCDSILETALTVIPLDTTLLSGKSCDTSLTGVFIDTFVDQNGCDSTTITTITYVLSDTTLLQSMTCDQMEEGVFMTVFTGQSGCDSIVIETVEYFPSDTTILVDETCDPDLAGIFSQTFTNIVGCDSLVIETIALLPSDTTQIINYSCSPMDTGTVSVDYLNVYGCDSLVHFTTALSLDDSCHVVEISKDVFIPNVFSPNNDGLNDLFFISSSEGAISNISFLRIFDRWGGLVFEIFDFPPNLDEHGWDGTENGEQLMPGVFVWMTELIYTDGEIEVRSGDVTLLR